MAVETVAEPGTGPAALEALFRPRSVAVVGAGRSPTSLGHGVLRNILESGFPGQVYPVNPNATEVAGLRCHPSVASIPDPVDLAVVVVPGPVVPGVLEDCARAGVRGVIVISAGFREAGREGAHLERRLVEIARAAGLRLVGPNCLGIIDAITPLNASFAAGMARRGQIAMMSQSGALVTAILDWAQSEDVGFARFVSLGNKADVNESDLLAVWGGDPDTRVIVAYLEGIVNGRRFMEVARRTTRGTPVVIVKSGRTAAGSRAVSSHTGTLAGADQAYEAAFRQCGVLRAASVQELFDFAAAFATQPLPPTEGVCIVTNAGGPAIMATDACESLGLALAPLQRQTIEALRAALPPAAGIYNPVDVLGDAGPERYGRALDLVVADSTVGVVVALATPQVMTQPTAMARAVVEAAARHGKPVLAGFMGGVAMQPALAELRRHGVPNYPFPERVVAAVGALLRQRTWLARPSAAFPSLDADRATVRSALAGVRADQRLALAEVEAQAVVAAYGVRTPRTVLARTVDEAVAAAEAVGYPVVLKIASPDILHKSDVGGVRVGLRDAAAVREAYDLIVRGARSRLPAADVWGVVVQETARRGREVIVGMSTDPDFGPLLMFGLGGVYVEVQRDVTFRVAPVTAQEAREMVQEIRSYPLLRGVRGEPPADVDAAVDTILRLSQLAVDFPEIVEAELNPLVLYGQGEGAVAVDARLTLRAED